MQGAAHAAERSMNATALEDGQRLQQALQEALDSCNNSKSIKSVKYYAHPNHNRITLGTKTQDIQRNK